MSAMAPRTGDLVRAQTDERDAITVEGELDLRLYEALGRRLLDVVVLENGQIHHVAPESIVVLQQSGLPQELLATRSDVFDLDDARSEGLIGEPREWVGGTWGDMFARLDLLVTPLLIAGWEIYEKERDQSCGDDWVVCLLRRGDSRLDVELSDRGWIDVWEIKDEPDEDDDGDPTPTTFQSRLEDDTFVPECRLRGWLGD
jgi:hypothetical protein